MPEGLFPFQHGGDSKWISVYIHLCRFGKCSRPLFNFRREAPYIWDDFLLLLLLLHSNLFHMQWECVHYMYVCYIYELVWW